MSKFLKVLAGVASLFFSGQLLATPAYTVGTPGAWCDSTGGGACTVTLPSFSAGNIGLLFSRARGSAQTLAVTGWTQLATNNADGSAALFCRVLQGGDTSPSVDWSGGTDEQSQIVVLSGNTWGDCTTIQSVTAATAAGGSDTTIKVPGLTITTANTLVITAGGKTKSVTSNGTTVNALSGFTTIGSNAPNGTSMVLAWGYVQQTTATNITATTWTLSGTTEAAADNGITVSLQTQSAPTFSVSPAVGTRTTSSVPITATTACTDCTMTGIEQTAGAAAPTVTQIKAGQDHTGSAAFKTCSVSPTANVQATCTFSSITDGTVKDAYLALNSTAGGDIASAASIANVYKIPADTVNPSVTSCTATSCTFGYTPDGAGTQYFVGCAKGTTAPTVTQVEAGQCTGGVAALASGNKASSGADSLTISGLTLPVYDFYAALTYGSQHEASPHSMTSQCLAAASGKQIINCPTGLTSILAGSPVDTFNASVTPDIAIGDIPVCDAATTPGAFSLTVGLDGTFSYSGDGSRQSAVCNFYDTSVGAMHADTLTFWSNNQAPIPPNPPDSVIFSMQAGVAITPIDLTQYCPDPEGDAVTVTAVSGLATGLSITNSVLSGTPSSSGITTLTLRCTDITGDHVDWH